MFGNNREQIRQFFQASWQKHSNNEALNGIEVIIVQVIQQHPEYHKLLEGNEDQLDRDFSIEAGETNPFLHMGMHITLAEQISTDRPAGIRALHQSISHKIGDVHQAEHQMMECLGQVLWEAQAQGKMPDDQAYIQCLEQQAAG